MGEVESAEKQQPAPLPAGQHAVVTMHGPAAGVFALQRVAGNASTLAMLTSEPRAGGAGAIPVDLESARLRGGMFDHRLAPTIRRKRSPAMRDLRLRPQFDSARVIRRYKDPTSDYTLASDEGASTPFTSFEDDPSVITRPSESGDVKKPGGVGFKKSTPAHPPVRVSDDGSIAINSQKGESKEFYATDEVFREANKALLEMESPIELVKGGNKITVGGKVLEMARPKLRTVKSPAKDQFVSLATHECRDVAGQVMGGGASSLLVNGKGVKAAMGDSTVLGGTHEIAKSMVEGKSANEAMDTADEADRDVEKAPKVGREYGTMLGKGELDDKAREYKVNQFAKAGIGESYATQRISNPEGESVSKDHSHPGSEEKVTWGYHFAAVVATSGDGKDQITLENYNRGAQYREAKAIMIQHLRDDFAEEVEALKGNLPDISVDESLSMEQRAVREKAVDTQRKVWIGLVLQRIKTGLVAEEGKAREAFDAMQNETLGTQVQKWYFRMVGEGAGQSFHEQMMDSGTFANPLTVVTGKADYGADTIKFAEGKTKVTDAEKEKLRGWARNMANNAERGLDFRLRVTGYASGEGLGTKARAKKNAKETAEKRAESVVEALEELGVAAEQIVSDTGARREDWTAEQARCVKLKLIHG